VIPVFDHGRELVAVVEELARFRLPCFVIDDGSAAPTRASIAKLAGENDWIRVERFPENRGKGAALKRGFELAASEGHTHAVQLDADGQHDPRALPGFLAALESNPDALVLGVPIFDASVPRVRLWARQLSKALVWAATLSLEIQDPLCGYRGVPLARALRLLRSRPTGDRMEFEPELAVHLYWDGARVISLPTPVSYPAGGVSHFGFWREYPRLALLYARLLIGMLGRLPALLRRRSTPREACA
jgi:glycosyltransferase involved in cell wall biosynthesis